MPLAEHVVGTTAVNPVAQTVAETAAMASKRRLLKFGSCG
jgi:hypothetical protein